MTAPEVGHCSAAGPAAQTFRQRPSAVKREPSHCLSCRGVFRGQVRLRRVRPKCPLRVESGPLGHLLSSDIEIPDGRCVFIHQRRFPGQPTGVSGITRVVPAQAGIFPMPDALQQTFRFRPRRSQAARSILACSSRFREQQFQIRVRRFDNASHLLANDASGVIRLMLHRV